MHFSQGMQGDKVPGPHHGPHVSQLNRDYVNLLRDQAPTLYESLLHESTSGLEPLENPTEHASHSWCNDAMVDMIEDIYIARERPFTKRVARCHDALKKEVETPIYSNAKLS